MPESYSASQEIPCH